MHNISTQKSVASHSFYKNCDYSKYSRDGAKFWFTWALLSFLCWAHRLYMYIFEYIVYISSRNFSRVLKTSRSKNIDYIKWNHQVFRFINKFLVRNFKNYYTSSSTFIYVFYFYIFYSILEKTVELSKSLFCYPKKEVYK